MGTPFKFHTYEETPELPVNNLLPSGQIVALVAVGVTVIVDATPDPPAVTVIAFEMGKHAPLIDTAQVKVPPPLDPVVV
jgi:hypothetical protein